MTASCCSPRCWERRSAAEVTHPGRAVLLVEDDPGDAFLVGELLAEVEPELRLTVAASLPEVVDGGLLADAECVLLDLNLPGTNGLEGLHAILRADAGAAVCVLTGLDDEHLGVAAVAAGAQDYLVKGKVDGPLLIRAIRYAVERRRAETSQLRLREEQLVAAEATRLERGLLPTPLLDGSPVRARAFYRSGRARSVLGGDFFDAVRGPDGTVHAIIGDVCGHGPDEAALGALLRVSWRALVLAGVDEPQVLPKLQQVLVSERHDATLFTTVCTVAIPTGGDAHVRLAGHPAPVVMHPPVQVEPLIGLPLGIAEHTSWEAEPLVLHAGWALLLYTDGLIEGKGPVPDEPLWPEGLIRLLDDERDTPHADLPARLVERAQVLNGGPLSDDVAILLLTADRT
ncbi:SpoIIE family protein phosphatase [Pseudonocardia sp. KRD-184]|uniref:SpoIIE family protein phosphatase n=1 Tax=Pseudonocardia oceani TaxID=2792013 RepID=A0ABS6U8I0_9PSEU|nr:SpoIIE family protein phosphatase [Pseudonocardia oceani]MBW0097218.1 SpoIIE family protein phosphatase [Pseudonocardia oceani]MBW0110220.1 SpoIIE family protein phosphatase [Pseudonocardia oceani]MBW0121488.1 SpoIIE family protein phosphatase [Pseudonocardia oceani]MBW0128545.1 SpoIIE family protein phosphatase [Pseudonocardia oceani]